jgi:hypothetical protein
MKWTIIVAADDCTSVQRVLADGATAEDAARTAFAECDWLADFRLIAVAAGEPVLYLRDDARTAECGLQ